MSIDAIADCGESLLRDALKRNLPSRFVDGFVRCQAPARPLHVAVYDIWQSNHNEPETILERIQRVGSGGLLRRANWFVHRRLGRGCAMFLKSEFSDWPLFHHWVSVAESAAKSLGSIGGFSGAVLWSVLLSECLGSRTFENSVPGSGPYQSSLGGRFCEFDNIIESSIALADLLSRQRDSKTAVQSALDVFAENLELCELLCATIEPVAELQNPIVESAVGTWENKSQIAARFVQLKGTRASTPNAGHVAKLLKDLPSDASEKGSNRNSERFYRVDAAISCIRRLRPQWKLKRPEF